MKAQEWTFQDSDSWDGSIGTYKCQPFQTCIRHEACLGNEGDRFDVFVVRETFEY